MAGWVIRKLSLKADAKYGLKLLMIYLSLPKELTTPDFFKSALYTGVLHNWLLPPFFSCQGLFLKSYTSNMITQLGKNKCGSFQPSCNNWKF